MKNIYFSIIAFMVLAVAITLTPGTSLAQTSTPEPTAEKDIETIEKIKDLVASKVAELKLVDKRGLVGKVKKTGNTQITLLDHKNKQRTVDIDELTKFESSAKVSFGISDIKEGDVISTIGLYNKDSERLLARFISRAANIPVNIDGVITEKVAKDFNIAFITSGGNKFAVDIETSTRTWVYNEGEIEKSGFSKLEVGQRAIVIGFTDLKEDNLINASRIIYFPGLALSQDLEKFIDRQGPASTDSGRNISPTPR